MKNIFYLSLIALALFSCRNEAEEKAQINISDWSRNDSLSYAEGLILKSEIEKNFDSLNMQLMWNAMSGKDTLMSIQDAENFLFNERKRRISEMKNKAIAEYENWKLKEGYAVHSSSFIYKITGTGNGNKAVNASEVEIIEKVTLTDGTVIMDSKGESAAFSVKNISPADGFGNAILLLEEGESIEAFIPYTLAFGPGGTQDGAVPPFANIILNIELVKIIN